MLISRVIFVALPLLLAPIAYGSLYVPFASFEACAVNKVWAPDAWCFTPKNPDMWGLEVCCWKEKNKEGKEVTMCQTCNKETRECDPPEQPPQTSTGGLADPELEAGSTLPGGGLAEPGQNENPTQTFPGGDLFGPPAGEVADPDAGQNQDDGGSKEDGGKGKTFRGGDVFNPPGEVADPGSGQSQEDGGSKEDGGKGKTFRGGDVFNPPDKAADPGAGQNQDDNNGNKGGGGERPDIVATGPEAGDVKKDLPSTGDGGSGDEIVG